MMYCVLLLDAQRCIVMFVWTSKVLALCTGPLSYLATQPPPLSSGCLWGEVGHIPKAQGLKRGSAIVQHRRRQGAEKQIEKLSAHYSKISLYCWPTESPSDKDAVQDILITLSDSSER